MVVKMEAKQSEVADINNTQLFLAKTIRRRKVKSIIRVVFL
jgi:hypothetical protein